MSSSNDDGKDIDDDIIKGIREAKQEEEEEESEKHERNDDAVAAASDNRSQGVGKNATTNDSRHPPLPPPPPKDQQQQQQQQQAQVTTNKNLPTLHGSRPPKERDPFTMMMMMQPSTHQSFTAAPTHSSLPHLSAEMKPAPSVSRPKERDPFFMMMMQPSTHSPPQAPPGVNVSNNNHNKPFPSFQPSLVPSLSSSLLLETKPKSKGNVVLNDDDEKASYKEMYETTTTVENELERKLPAKPSTRSKQQQAGLTIADEKALYRLDRGDDEEDKRGGGGAPLPPHLHQLQPSFQPPVSSSSSSSSSSTITPPVLFAPPQLGRVDEVDEKEPYRPAPALSLAPPSSSLLSLSSGGGGLGMMLNRTAVAREEDDEKAPYRLDIAPSSLAPLTTAAASLSLDDEKAAYRLAGPSLSLAGSSASASAIAAFPSFASGTVGGDGGPTMMAPGIAAGPDLALSKTSWGGGDGGISVAQGRHDLASDELFAAAVATEGTIGGIGNDGKGGGGGGIDGKSFKGGVATISPGRGQRIPRATAPGVEYIRRRAPGMRPSWYTDRLSRSSLTVTSDSEQPSEQSIASLNNRHNQQHRDSGNSIPPSVPTRRLPAVAEANWSIPKLRESQQGWYFLWAFVAMAVIGIALGVGLGIASRNNDNGGGSGSGGSGITNFAPYTLDCSTLATTANPHVVTQCYCTNTIATVASDIAAQYNVLKQTFMIPTINANFNETMDSCSPQNQALLWLASGNGGISKIDANAGGSAASTPSMLQRYRLAELFLSWKGPGWGGNLDWLSADDDCTWTGLVCNSQQEVIQMILSKRNISGDIPLEHILYLPRLSKLDLAQNGIDGSLPLALGNQSALVYVDLSSNNLNGSIPTTLGRLTALQQLRLGVNNLDGIIPSELGLLQRLRAVDLSKNSFSGQLPAELGMWNYVTTVLLDSNRFHTTLPTEFGLMSSLEKFQMLTSGVYGTLPTELFHIGTPLSLFDFSYNDLSGTIPTEVGQARFLSTWLVLNNNITGTIPTEFGNTELIDFKIQYNQISGTVPTELGRLTNTLQAFDLSANLLNGTLPKVLCNVETRISCNHNFQCMPSCECSCGTNQGG